MLGVNVIQRTLFKVFLNTALQYEIIRHCHNSSPSLLLTVDSSMRPKLETVSTPKVMKALVPPQQPMLRTRLHNST